MDKRYKLFVNYKHSAIRAIKAFLFITEKGLDYFQHLKKKKKIQLKILFSPK